MNGRTFLIALFSLIVGLAAFGLIAKAVTDPYDIVKNILTMLVVAGIFYLLYKVFTSSSGSANGSQSSYKRAAKQSNKKYGKKNVTPLSNTLLKRNASDSKGKKDSPSPLKRKRKPSHLTVIEGKKNKKKDRASF
ncbi:membrane protein [Bacillus manliponensis]|uniref:Membrane protein n=1 Tax=Bacillus manliponensis TaxID=574376 RepID=A0A073JX49_9BACI|nr:SA1362 family protein [Bacillus manliponensis]KEK19579.1 membrane protein [Bacillus manliponensis]